MLKDRDDGTGKFAPDGISSAHGEAVVRAAERATGPTVQGEGALWGKSVTSSSLASYQMAGCQVCRVIRELNPWREGRTVG